MAWYLYITGVFVMLCLFLALNLSCEEHNKLHPVIAVIISALWPVTFPALVVGAILSGVLDGVDSEM